MADREPSGRAFAAAFTALVVVFAVFHHVPAFLPGMSADFFDLVTPFAVVAAAAATLLALGPPAWLLVAAGVAAVAYVDGHGIHLAANSIGHLVEEGTPAYDRVHFWDELFGHIEWHAGWLGLLAVVAIAGRRELDVPRARLLVAGSAVVLGFTLFTSGVEGGTWYLFLAAAALVVPYAFFARTVPALAVGGSLAVCAALMGIWAIWQGGMPQFSEVDLL